jgi:hypothetical protein
MGSELWSTHIEAALRKLRDKEPEWRIQMEKLGSDLDGCLSKLDSRDILVTKLQYDLQRSNRSL